MHQLPSLSERELEVLFPSIGERQSFKAAIKVPINLTQNKCLLFCDSFVGIVLLVPHALNKITVAPLRILPFIPYVTRVTLYVPPIESIEKDMKRIILQNST